MKRVSLLVVLLSVVIGCTTKSLPVLYDLPNFSFTASSGTPFGTAEMREKITIVDFIFTRCKGVCPVMAASMSDLYHRFEEDSNVQFVSITVDPAHDTLQVLQQYAKDVGVSDNRWQFLWAPIEKIVDLSENGFKLSAENLPGGHSSRFVLIDKSAKIRGYFDGLEGAEMDKLSAGIRQLLRSR